MCWPQKPWVLPRSSSNKPTTVPNGCNMSRLPTRPEEFANPSGNLVEPDRSSSRCVPMPFAASTVHVQSAAHKTVTVHLQSANARAGDKLHAHPDVLRPMRDVHGTLRAFDATPHAGRALRARAQRTVGAGGDGIGR